MAFQAREVSAVNRDSSLAWFITKLSRSKPVPIERVLIETGKPKRQSVEEQRQVLHAMSQRYGLTMRPAKAKKQKAHGG